MKLVSVTTARVAAFLHNSVERLLDDDLQVEVISQPLRRRALEPTRGSRTGNVRSTGPDKSAPTDRPDDTRRRAQPSRPHRDPLIDPPVTSSTLRPT